VAKFVRGGPRGARVIFVRVTIAPRRGLAHCGGNVKGLSARVASAPRSVISAACAISLVLSCCLLGGALADVSAQDSSHGPSDRAPQGAPTEYSARTDVELQPVTSVPHLGPAGSVVDDPDFKTPILRVTDQNTLSRRPNISFHTDGSGEANEWNTDSTYFYVIGSGNTTLLYRFDPDAMRATYLMTLDDPAARLRLPAFSRVNPNLIYGITPNPHPEFAAFDLSRRARTEIHDPASCLKFGPDILALDLDVSAGDRRLVANFGPRQDDAMYVYVYDGKLGCRWYNTQTGEIGGEWGPKGMASLADRYGVHNVRISLDGNWVRIGRGKCYSTNCARGPVFWNVSTLEAVTCLQDATESCLGHKAMGYSEFINTSGRNHPFEVLKRPYGDLHSPAPLLTHLPSWTNQAGWPDKHWSWNNDNPSDTAPICGTSYSTDNPTTPGALPNIRQPWEGEIICMSTDGRQPKVWRFAHHFSSGTNGFWSTPRGNVSQDGRFYLFTSDWMNTLGMEPNGKRHREDVFLIPLR
jgi:hypothetical protein